MRYESSRIFCPAFEKSLLRSYQRLFFCLHTAEFDLNRGIATEEIDHHLDSSLPRIHFDDFAFTAFEWTTFHDDIISNLHISTVFFTLLCEDSLQFLEFFTADGNRNGTSTEKSCHIRSIAYDVPTLIGDDHLDEDIAGENIFLSLDFLASSTDRDRVVRRDEDIENILFESECFSSLHE